MHIDGWGPPSDPGIFSPCFQGGKVRSLANKSPVLVRSGISSLTTALCLYQKGAQVIVVAEKFVLHVVTVIV